MKPGNFFGANPKTTIAGIVTLITAGFAIYHNPAVLADPNAGPPIIASIGAGLGMIFARDSKAADPVRPPTIGEQAEAAPNPPVPQPPRQ